MSSPTRSLTRLAWRTARHHPGRTALVALLIALAVAVGISAGVITRSSQSTTSERDHRALGAADLLVVSGNPYSTVAPSYERPPLPPGEVAERWVGSVDPVGSYPVEAVATDHADPLVAPSVRVRDGRLPTAAGEAALSTRLAEHLELGVGDTLMLQSGRSLTIVGTVTDPLAIREHQVRLHLEDRTLLDLALAGWLVDLPGTPSVEELRALAYDLLDTRPQLTVRLPGDEQLPFIDVSDTELLDRPAVVSALVAGVLLVEVVLIAAAAYATATRRRLREFGLLTANGASPAHLRRLVVIEAGLTGLVGAALGVMLAAGGLWLARPLVQELSDRQLGYRFTAVDVLVPLALGVLASAVAAWLPARIASRVPVRSALIGRTPSGRVPVWMAPVGAAAIVVGLLVLAAAAHGPRTDTQEVLAGATGAVLTVIGGALLTPGLLAAVATLGARLPHQLRMVVRDSARQRTRAATAVAALIAVLMIPIMVTTIASSEERARELRYDVTLPNDMALVSAYDDETGSPTPVGQEVVDVFAGALEVEASAPVAVATTRGNDQAHLWVEPDSPVEDHEGYLGGSLALATPELVETLGLDPVAANQAIADGKVIALGERKPAQVSLVGLDGNTSEPLARFETAILGADLQGWALPQYLASETVFAELDLAASEGSVLVRAAAPLDAEDRRALERLTVDLTSLSVTYEPASPAIDATPASAIALLLAVAVTMAIIAVTTALAATESDADMETAVAVGAEPRFRPRYLALQAGYHALAAAVIAVPLALLAVVVVHRPEYWAAEGIVVPWAAIAIVLVAIPAVSAVATGIAARPAPTVAPRRVT